MANSVCEVLVTEARLESAAGTAATTEDVDLSAGAVVDFWGVVRKLEAGREIDGIDYEAHRAMAEHQLEQIAAAASEKFQLRKVVVHHRIGFVRAGETSLFVSVAAQRRSAAFEASEWIVDELKKKVPIWKRPRLRQGYGAASAINAETMLRK
jgi:molybdopterin synthase catalytic subunit